MDLKLKNDRKALGALILYKIVKNKKKSIDKQKTVWEAYQSFSKGIGDDFMSFPDFEHFYWKLEKGECELDYDGSLKYNRHLCDLPVDVIKMIVQKLTNGEKWIFREASSALCKIVDPCLAECNKLEIYLSKEELSVSFEGDSYDSRVDIQYSLKKIGESEEWEQRRSFGGCEFGNGGRTFEESIIRDISKILKDPKTRLVDLDIYSSLPEDIVFFEHLKPLLKSQKYVQNVTISTSSPSHFISMLSCLKPEILKEIYLESYEKNMDLSGILKMDQVKHAKQLTFLCPEATYPLNHLMHLEDFYGNRDGLKPEEVLMIKNKLTRTGKMKSFKIFTGNGLCWSLTRKLRIPLNPEFNDTADRRHFRIRNSDEFVKLEIDADSIEFSRVATVEDRVDDHEEDELFRLFH